VQAAHDLSDKGYSSACGDIYDVLRSTSGLPADVALTSEALGRAGRILQLALQLARDEGMFAHLEQQIAAHGKAGMLYRVPTKWLGDDSIGDGYFYVKTAASRRVG
jgi:hypothetical protein